MILGVCMMTEKLEAGKGGSPAAAPEKATQKSRRFGIGAAAATLVGTAGIAALIFARSCGPSGPDRLPVAVETATPAPVVQNNCPQPGERCNLELGEHDPHSSMWSPAKCGYCGDNIQQAWETADNCPVDFHCGDGNVNRGTIYGAYIAPGAQGGAYSLGTITVTESCTSGDTAFCEADCPAPRGGAAPATSGSGGRRTGRRDTAEPGSVATTVAPPSGGLCDSEVTSRFMNRVSSSLLGNPSAARSAAGATDQTVRASVSISISNGVPRVSAIRVSCPGCSGGALSPGTVSVGGIPIDRSTTCNTSISVNIPPG
jgi:hypothetical protein